MDASTPARGGSVRGRAMSTYSESHHHHRSSSVTRRTRSASPAVMESTLTAVQAALNRRQLQVHGFRAKLANAEQTVEQLRR